MTPQTADATGRALVEKLREAREWWSNDASIRCGDAADALTAALDRVQALQGELAEAQAERDAAREALRPFARFAEAWDAKPFSGMDDEFYCIHTGTEYAASLRLSQCRAARAALNQPTEPKS